MNWEKIVSYVNPGWVGVLTTTVLGIAAIVVSYYLRHRVAMSYQWWLVRLIGGDSSALPDDIKISFKDVPVPRLSSSTVVIWNTGNTTISGQNIVSSDPLCLIIDRDAQILEVKITSVTREVVAFKSHIDPSYRNVISLDFDFLDPHDGAAIEILHTGDPGKLTVSGTIRGMPQGLKNRGKLPRSRRVIDYFPGYWMMWLFGISLFIVNLFRPTNISSTSKEISILFYFPGIVFFLVPILIGFLQRRRQIPKQLADSVGLARWYH